MNFATTKERILHFIENQDIKVSDFLRKTEIKRGFLDADKLNSAVSDVFLAKIIAVFPELSLEWLITGKGEMLKNSEQNITQNGNNNTNNGHNISGNRNKIEQTNAELLEIIREKDRQIASLHKIIEKLSS